MRKNHDGRGVMRVSSGASTCNFAGGTHISRSVCVCGRVFADPLRDGGRRRKTGREGGSTKGWEESEREGERER